MQQYSVEDLMQLFGSAGDISNHSNQGCKVPDDDDDSGFIAPGNWRMPSEVLQEYFSSKTNCKQVQHSAFPKDEIKMLFVRFNIAFRTSARVESVFSVDHNADAYKEKPLESVSRWVGIKSEDNHLSSRTIDQRQTWQESYEEYANRRLKKTKQAYKTIADPSNNFLHWKIYSEKDAYEVSVYDNTSERDNSVQFHSQTYNDPHSETGFSSFWCDHVWLNAGTRYNELVLGMYGEQNKPGNKCFIEEFVSSPEITDITDAHSSNQCSALPEKPEVNTHLITTDSNMYYYMPKDLIYPNHGTYLNSIQTLDCMLRNSNALRCCQENCNSQWYETKPVYSWLNQSYMSTSSVDSFISSADDTTKTQDVSGSNVTTNTATSPYNWSTQNTSFYTSRGSFTAKAGKKRCRLWEFIRNLLLDPETNPSFIRWENREDGLFKLVQSKGIARLWGMKKGNEAMNYEKLSRAMRYYYKRKIFEPVLGKRLVYRFGPKATGWREDI